jgi:hypothetical protein
MKLVPGTPCGERLRQGPTRCWRARIHIPIGRSLGNFRSTGFRKTKNYGFLMNCGNQVSSR